MVRPRVVSLVPSLTETLLAWGITPIACTRFCEQPALHHVGGTKDPDLSGIVDLAPDLVVVDREENRVEDHDALVGAGLTVHVTAVRHLDDLDQQMAALADLVGGRWDALHPGAPPPVRATAVVPIWRRPWMALGDPTYGSSMLRHLGIGNVASVDGPYPALDLEQVAARHPDMVVAPDEPYPFGERHRAELATVAPVHFVDGRDLFWWGARTRDALTRLRSTLAPAG